MSHHGFEKSQCKLMFNDLKENPASSEIIHLGFKKNNLFFLNYVDPILVLSLVEENLEAPSNCS